MLKPSGYYMNQNNILACSESIDVIEDFSFIHRCDQILNLLKNVS